MTLRKHIFLNSFIYYENIYTLTGLRRKRIYNVNVFTHMRLEYLFIVQFST